MTTPMPQQRLAQAFVQLAGSSVTEPSDRSGLLGTLASQGPALLGSNAATVLYVPDGRSPAQLTGTDEKPLLLEQEAVERREGPAHEAYTGGRPVRDCHLESSETEQRWPQYAPRAVGLGYRRVAALPMPIGLGHQETLGALVLLRRDDDPFPADVLTLAQSLADAAGCALARHREMAESRALADQLGHALTSRVVIEQAKGVLAARLSVTVDEAFALLRRHARSKQRRLSEVAREVVDGRLELGDG
ncbi:ANTAR domain-containing protein [Streptomyces sp. NPDC059785]|uniref:ANTAR domain-containing protein n=1 Tax=Streptomyces sp. NPDC059785 TaxID=3346945 RepID=UPI00365D982F